MVSMGSCAGRVVNHRGSEFLSGLKLRGIAANSKPALLLPRVIQGIKKRDHAGISFSEGLKIGGMS